VLFVDDEEPILRTVGFALGDAFENEGLELLTVQGGAGALELLREREIAVLVTDQRMPGMTGTEVCAEAKKRSPETIRMILTAYADVESAIEAIERGSVHRYMRKPFDNDELLQTVVMSARLYQAKARARTLQHALFAATEASHAARQELAHEIANVVQPFAAQIATLGKRIRALYEEHDDEQHENLLRLTASCAEWQQQVVDLCRSVLREASPVGHCDAYATARDIASLLRSSFAERGVEVRVEGEPLDVPMTSSALAQVLVNLMTNGAQAIARAGREGHVLVQVGEDHGWKTVRIRDDGEGIPVQLRSRVFESRFTTHPDGSGLGLPLVRRLIAETGGRVELEAPEVGACFLLQWSND